MSTNNKNTSAFPIALQNGLSNDCHVDAGITKREYFAAMAMQGILANHWCRNDFRDKINGLESNVVASQAIEFADAILKELEKQSQ